MNYCDLVSSCDSRLSITFVKAVVNLANQMETTLSTAVLKTRVSAQVIEERPAVKFSIRKILFKFQI